MIQIVAAPAIRSNVRGARSRTSLEHGDASAVRVSEPWPAVLVAREEVLHEERVLLVPRLVETESLPDECQVLRRRRLSGEAQCRIAGRHEVEDRERQHQDDEDDESRPEKPADDVQEHDAEGTTKRGALEAPRFASGQFVRFDYLFSDACANPARPAFWSKDHVATFGRDDVDLVRPHVWNPRHDLLRQHAVERGVAGEPWITDLRSACGRCLVDAGDIASGPLHAHLLRLRRRQPDERVVPVADRHGCWRRRTAGR